MPTLRRDASALFIITAPEFVFLGLSHTNPQRAMSQAVSRFRTKYNVTVERGELIWFCSGNSAAMCRAFTLEAMRQDGIHISGDESANMISASAEIVSKWVLKSARQHGFKIIDEAALMSEKEWHEERIFSRVSRNNTRRYQTA